MRVAYVRAELHATRRQEMRKFLMASAATLGAMGVVRAVSAQTLPPAAYLEGQIITTPNPSPPAGANTNNNFQAAMLPGPVANPTPGTFVVKLNLGLVTEAGLQSSSVTKFTTAGSATPFAPAGTFKQNPQAFLSYFRIYPGVDAMATNGLRYGAAVELRQNADSTTPSGGFLNNASSSGVTSGQSLFVRRAFAYVAADKFGIVRFGQGDSVLGIFDGGITTFQNVSPSGGLDGSDEQVILPQNVVVPFPFFSLDGIDYGNNKVVYLSPQLAGFDFGLEYAPSNNNAAENGLCANGTNTNPSVGGVSGVNAATCSATSSSPLASDAIRYTNQFEVGARYQGTFGPVAVLAHGTYMGSGIVDFTGTPPTVAANAGNPHGWNGKYQPLSLFQGGLALTVAGLTFGGAVNTGHENNNGQGSPAPRGGASQIAYTVGFSYANGPLVVGAEYEQVDSQGSANLVGISQRHEWAFSPDIDYVLAPGLKVFAEYYYGHRHQGDFNFATGAVGSTAFNNVQAQSFIVGSRVYW
jgi:predicted porin